MKKDRQQKTRKIPSHNIGKRGTRQKIMPQEIAEARFRDYFRILLTHKWIVLFGFLIVFGVTVLYLKKATPIYRAETILMREDQSNRTVSLFQNISSLPGTKSIQSQQFLIKSTLVLSEVVQKMADNGFLMTEDNIKSNISLSIVGNSADLLRITADADSPQKAMLLANITADVYIKKRANMKSQELTRAEQFLQTQMNLTNSKLQDAEEALNAFKESEGLIGKDLNREGSSGLLQQLGDLYSQLSQTQMDKELISAQLNTVRQMADEKKKQIKPFVQNQSTKKIERLQSILSEWQVDLAVLRQSFTDKNKKVVNLKNRISVAQEQLESEFQKLLNEQTDLTSPLSEWQSFAQQVGQLDIQLKGLQQKEKLLKQKIEDFRKKHPKLISKEIELTKLERQARLHEQIYLNLMDRYEETRMLKQMKGAGIAIIDKATKPLSPIKPKKRIVLTLGIIIGLLLGIGGAFFLEYIDDSLRTEKDIEKLIQLPVVGVIPKIEPEKKVVANLEKEMQKSSNNPVPISSKNNANKSKRKKKHDKNYKESLINLRSKMISNFSSRSPVVESYRSLLTNIKFANVDNEIKTILVSSPSPQEGKSLTATNFAICLARTGTQTLIIDCDLRRPRLHKLLEQYKEPGLSELLADEINDDNMNAEKWENAVQLVKGDIEIEQTNLNNNFIRKSSVENLYLLPSGTRPPNPAEILGSEQMKKLINFLKTQFDIIIFDSPPIVAVSDASVIASELTDSVLLVIKAGKTKKTLGLRAREMLEKVNANIFGVVLNNFDYNKHYGSYYYYYYYHYRYYYADESDEDESVEDS